MSNQPIIKAFKTRIYLTKEQEVYFKKAFGIRRWVYNWAIDEYYKELNESGKKLGNYDLAKILNHTKVNDDNYKWLSKVNGMIRQEALRDLIVGIKSSKTKLEQALKSKKYTSIDDIPVGKFKPKYKSKKNSNNSFRYHIKTRKCVLPINPISKHYFTMMTVGGKTGHDTRFTIKSKESLLFLNDTSKYRICEYTFSEKNGKYYLSISYERTNYKINKSILPKKNTKIGIDMGVHTFLTCYDGNESFELTSDIIMKKLKKQEKKSEHLRSCLCKKRNNIEKYNKTVKKDKKVDYKYSKRYEKLRNRMNKSYEKENNLKKEFREQITYYLVKNYRNINIEEYSFHSRKKSYKKANIGYNRKLARLGGYYFMERLKEKALIFNTNLTIIPKFTATTQTCSCCGYRRTDDEKLKLNERTYYCLNCGTTLGRDENASINIYNYN